MAATTLESFLNLPNPLTKRDRRRRRCCSSLSTAPFSVRFEPVLIPITPHSTIRRSWTNSSAIVARNTIINVSPSKLGSRLLGTCFLSLDPIHRSWFNSRLVVAVPAFISSAAKQDDDDSDEHSELADDVENEKKMISSSIGGSSDDQNIKEIVLLINAEEEEEESQKEEVAEAAAAAAAATATATATATAANWNWNWNWNWRHIISRMLDVDSFKEYLISAENKSPEEVIKDIIVETFAYSSSSTPDHHLIKDASNKLEDFHLGIPYGALLSLGGFLSFMITGSISGIRFGVILGGTLLALSISSLRYSHATAPLQQPQANMKLGQAAIAGIIFLRHLGLLFQRPSFPNSFTALISGGMVVFYLYTIMLDGGGLTVRKKNRSELA